MEQINISKNSFILCDSSLLSFIEIIKNMNNRLNEINLKFDKDKLYINEIEPANVCLDTLEFFNSNFVEYELDKPFNIGLNLDSLKEVLKNVNAKKDTLRFNIEDNKLNLIKLNGVKTTFNIALIEVEDNKNKGNLNFKTKIIINSKILKDIIKNFNKEIDTLNIEVNKEYIVFFSNSNSINIKLDLKDYEEDLFISTDNEFINKYSVEFLKGMITDKITDNIVLELNKQYPLRLSYKGIDNFNYSVILAPRVESD